MEFHTVDAFLRLRLTGVKYDINKLLRVKSVSYSAY
jgi:hypothetical protein